MEAYTNFAEVYDTFMDNVPYEQWAAYIKETLKEDGIADGLVLELGCGTGSMTERLAEAGYDMIGVDNSADMLEIALDKRGKSGQDILYLLQDMREFELYGTVRAIISACDCVNYVTEDEDLLQVFRLVNNYLDPEGIFIFDLNTLYKYENILGEQTIGETREDHCFIWDNYYDKESQINEYVLNLFIQGGDGRYDRCEEVHYQKGYALTEIRELIEAAGMIWEGAYDAFTMEPPKADSERVYIVAREHGKK